LNRGRQDVSTPRQFSVQGVPQKGWLCRELATGGRVVDAMHADGIAKVQPIAQFLCKRSARVHAFHDVEVDQEPCQTGAVNGSARQSSRHRVWSAERKVARRACRQGLGNKGVAQGRLPWRLVSSDFALGAILTPPLGRLFFGVLDEGHEGGPPAWQSQRLVSSIRSDGPSLR